MNNASKPVANTPPFDLKDYRQPLITSLGIIIGFLLGFLGQWVTEDNFNLKSGSDILTFWGSVTGIGLLLYALFSILSPCPATQDALAFYRRVLRLYIAGVGVAMASIVIAAFI